MTLTLPSIGTIYAVLVLFLTVPTVITCILCAVYHRVWGLGGINSDLVEAQHDIKKLGNLHTRMLKSNAAEKGVDIKQAMPSVAEMREKASQTIPDAQVPANGYTYPVR